MAIAGRRASGRSEQGPPTTEGSNHDGTAPRPRRRWGPLPQDRGRGAGGPPLPRRGSPEGSRRSRWARSSARAPPRRGTCSTPSARRATRTARAAPAPSASTTPPWGEAWGGLWNGASEQDAEAESGADVVDLEEARDTLRPMRRETTGDALRAARAALRRRHRALLAHPPAHLPRPLGGRRLDGDRRRPRPPGPRPHPRPAPSASRSPGARARRHEGPRRDSSATDRAALRQQRDRARPSPARRSPATPGLELRARPGPPPRRTRSTARSTPRASAASARPIFAPDGRVAASIAISTPARRFGRPTGRAHRRGPRRRHHRHPIRARGRHATSPPPRPADPVPGGHRTTSEDVATGYDAGRAASLHREGRRPPPRSPTAAEPRRPSWNSTRRKR